LSNLNPLTVNKLLLLFTLALLTIGCGPSTTTGTEDSSTTTKTYKTVKIGAQVWMSENLAYKPSTGNYWAYDDDNSNVAKYGYLYDWETACKVCPSGWHLPSDEEWTTLIDYLGGEDVAGGKIKTVGTIQAGTGLWNNPNTGATNESGFAALPGGGRSNFGAFYFIGDSGGWWSATQFSASDAWARHLGTSNAQVGRDGYTKKGGCSVRCVRD